MAQQSLTLSPTDPAQGERGKAEPSPSPPEAQVHTFGKSLKTSKTVSVNLVDLGWLVVSTFYRNMFGDRTRRFHIFMAMLIGNLLSSFYLDKIIGIVAIVLKAFI